MITLILTPAQISMASHVAVLRRVFNLEHDIAPKHGADDSWEGDIRGCCAELAVARYCNLFWCGTVGDFKARDVGGLIEVRNTTRRSDRLILHPEDFDGAPFVSAWVDLPNVLLRGWMFGHEGKQGRFWSDPTGKGRPAFFVPGPYRDMSDLRDWAGWQNAA